MTTNQFSKEILCFHHQQIKLTIQGITIKWLLSYKVYLLNNFNGRNVSRIQPTNILPKSPLESVAHTSISGPSTSGSSIIKNTDNDRIELSATGPTSNNGTLIREEITLNSVNPVANLSKESQKRREFFIQMKDEFTYSLYHQNQRHPRPKIFNEDGSYVVDHPRVPYNYGFAYSFYECLGCSDEALRASRPSNAPPSLSDDIPISMQKFAARFALGLVYQYQDHIPIMSDESLRALRAYFIKTMCKYIFITGVGYEERTEHFKNIGTGTLYQLLMYDFVLPTQSSQTLYTINGFKFSLRDLQSTGLRTSFGAKYAPDNKDYKKRFDKLQSQRDFPLYRWGSPDVLNLRWIKSFYKNIRSLAGDGVDLDYEDHNAIDFCEVESATPQSYNFEKDFWVSAEQFARQYLSTTEWGSLFSITV